MPLFTAENARVNALKSAQVRRDRRERLKNPPPPPLQATQMPDEEARSARVMKQLDKVDEFLEQSKNSDEFVKLTAAKERLWNLVFPKAGVMRPRHRRHDHPYVHAEPLEPVGWPADGNGKVGAAARP